MKKTVALPVSQAKEGRETSALEKSLIRFFERELEVKLTRREMWQSVSFFARSLAFLEKNPHLCNAEHFEKATMFANFAVGIFYAQWYHIVPTPVWSVNAPTAWLVKSNGKGGTALIS